MEKLKAGQALAVKRIKQLSPQDVEMRNQLNLSPSDGVNVTYVDDKGVSVYIRRMTGGGDIHGFIPASGVGLINWSTFFESGVSINGSYIESKHANKIFPTDFLS